MGIAKRLAGLLKAAKNFVGLAAVPRARKEGLLELLEQQGRILDMIAKGIKPKPILQELAGFIERHTDSGCAVYLPDGERGPGKLLLTAASGLPREYVRRIQGMELAPFMGVCGAAAAQRRLVVVADAGRDSRCLHYFDLLLEHPQLRSCWAVPILASDGSVAAVFELHREIHASPTPDALELLKVGGQLLRLATEGMQIREELHRRLYYDEMTGLPNRSFFRERLQQAFRQGEGSPRPFVVLYFEILGLQEIQERLGQVAEDDGLKQIADLLSDGLPAAAVLCRMGESRFAALVWDIEEKAATMLGRRLAMEVGSRPFPLDPACRLTAAVGIGSFSKHGEGVLQAAKADLYRSKDPKHWIGG